MIPQYNHKVTKEPATDNEERPKGSCVMFVLMLILLIVILTVAFYFAFYKSGKNSSNKQENFEKILQRVCHGSPHRQLEYEGVQSFFQYLNQPQHELCSSWIHIHYGDNETLPEPSAFPKHFCKPNPNDSLDSPCHVYSFNQHLQEHFEEHFKPLGCQLHLLSHQESAHPYDELSHPRDIQIGGRRRQEPRKALGLIEDSTLGNLENIITYFSIDVEGPHWSIIRQLISLHGVIEAKQVSARIELPIEVLDMPSSETHQHLSKLHQVLAGMNCMGYKLIRSEHTKMKPNGATNQVGEDLTHAYDVNWMKID